MLGLEVMKLKFWMGWMSVLCLLEGKDERTPPEAMAENFIEKPLLGCIHRMIRVAALLESHCLLISRPASSLGPTMRLSSKAQLSMAKRLNQQHANKLSDFRACSDVTRYSARCCHFTEWVRYVTLFAWLLEIPAGTP